MRLTRSQRLRLGFLFVVVCLFFAVVVARLIHLQLFHHDQYSRIVQHQSRGSVDIPAARGLVYDRNGQVVADNCIQYALYAWPADSKQLREVSRFLDRFYGLKPGSASRRYSLARRKFRWIDRRLSDRRAEVLATEAPRGLYLRKATRRNYPYGTVGKQILGFTDIDNTGQSGLELTYDSLLAGRKGRADICRDGLRNTYRVNETALVRPEPGRSLVLTVDWRLQEIVEQELARATREHQARSAQAVFLDCHHGDILAMAHYDPNESHPDKPTKLRAVADQFEPGSVFKAITAAGLLEDGLVDFTDSVNCENGKWRLGGRVLHDDKKHEWLTFRRIMELSSNIGIAKHAIDLGGEKLYEGVRRFGIGQKLRVGLPGETAGSLTKPHRWSDYTVASLAMGHAVATTSLQMANAFAAIANGGELLRPNLVVGLVDDDGYVIETRRREVNARVMSCVTADTLRSILRGVVENGTATPVNSPTVTIAGKTGTAEIPDLENGGYFKNRFVGSFAGFFPAEKPLVAGIVVLEDPHPVHYGGWTAGPAFRAIAERYAALRPDFFAAPDRTLTEADNHEGPTVEVPDLVGRGVDLARTMAEEHRLRLRCDHDQGHIIWQYPPADRLVFAGDEIVTIVSTTETEAVPMPDLHGLSIREASACLSFLGVEFEIRGTGRVVQQSIRPGLVVKQGTLCRINCRRG